MVKRLVQPAVVHINVVSVTDVHDVFCCDDDGLRLTAGDEVTPGEECALDVEQACGGTELYRGECAEIYTNNMQTHHFRVTVPVVYSC